MPGLITHYLCAQEVLAKLPTSAAAAVKANVKLYNVGAQGPDIFLYYIPGMMRRDWRVISPKLHHENVRGFLRAAAKGLKRDASHGAFAYFAGFLTHYALDCAVHPYVFYRTGFLLEGEQGRKIKYYSYHLRFETAIDTLMLKLKKQKSPKDVALWKYVAVDKQAAETARHLSAAIAKAHGIKIPPKRVLSALREMGRATWRLQSKRGRRKKIVGAAESALVGGTVISAIIHEQRPEGGIDYLNKSRQMWRNPWDENSERYQDFLELFEAGVNESAALITLLWKYLNNEIPLREFLQAAGDRSFISGRPIAEKVTFRVHDCVYDC